ncbi:MAG TPA: hypothetical protein VMD49_04775 [Steroidobacteraceae bacterium]|nr:hypothetical protein [Steroidobacteraceae bacterium]
MRRPMRAATVLALAGSLLALAVLGLEARAQSSLRAPESVRIGLGILDEVVTDSGRLITAADYDALPRQTERFEAGVTALEQGLGEDSSPLRKQIEPLLARARVAASAMREAASARRISMLPIAHQQLADAVHALIALFPPDLRPAQAPRNIR